MTIENPIEAKWRIFWESLGTLGVSDQIAALEPLLRRVFFGGAWSMFQLLGDAAETETGDDLPTINAVVAEVRRFVAENAKEGSVKAN